MAIDAKVIIKPKSVIRQVSLPLSHSSSGGFRGRPGGHGPRPRTFGSQEGALDVRNL